MKVKVDVTYVQTIVVKINSGMILQVNDYKLPGKYRKVDLQSRVFDPNKTIGMIELGRDRNILPEGVKEKIVYCKTGKIELSCREDHLLKDAGVLTGLIGDYTNDGAEEEEGDEING